MWQLNILRIMNNQGQNQQGIGIEESQGMDDDERELFLNVKRSKSDDSFLGKLLISKDGIDRRQLILDIPEPTNNNLAGFRVFRKQKKQKKKNQSDYRKNICGYITKKIIREFVSPNYQTNVKERCQKHNVSYATVKSFFLSKIQQVTGPSHIPRLLVPQSLEQVKIKKVFCQYFQWFLKERYLRYLLIEGKMADKKAYIQYKNNFLLSMLNESKDIPFTKKQEIQSSSSQEEDEEEDSEDNEMSEEKPKKQ